MNVKIINKDTVKKLSIGKFIPRSEKTRIIRIMKDNGLYYKLFFKRLALILLGQVEVEVEFDGDTYDKLKAIATAHNTEIGELINMIIPDYLDSKRRSL